MRTSPHFSNLRQRRAPDGSPLYFLKVNGADICIAGADALRDWPTVREEIRRSLNMEVNLGLRLWTWILRDLRPGMRLEARRFADRMAKEQQG